MAEPAENVAVAPEADPALRRIAILPACNEERKISRVIDKICAVEPGFEIVVVDDGSSDRIAIVAEREIEADTFHVLALARVASAA